MKFGYDSLKNAVSTVPSVFTSAPLTKYKHILVTALFAAAGQFIASLANQGAISQPVGAAIGVLISEFAIYDHSE